MKKQTNIMEKPYMAKILLSAGATGQDLDKAKRLLELVSGMKAQIIKAGPKRRIPAFGVKPGLELGTRVTLRGEKARETLKRLLEAVNNTIKMNQIADNHFSFGIKEYIEIPGMEYIREIGIRGFNVTVVFQRKGLRVKNKKIKSGRLPKRQNVSPEEIANLMKEEFKTKVQ